MVVVVVVYVQEGPRGLLEHTPPPPILVLTVSGCFVALGNRYLCNLVATAWCISVGIALWSHKRVGCRSKSICEYNM
eukprot:gene4632-biopygen12710